VSRLGVPTVIAGTVVVLWTCHLRAGDCDAAISHGACCVIANRVIPPQHLLLRRDALGFDTLRRDALGFDTLRRDALGFDTLRRDTLRLGTLRRDTLRFDTLRFDTLRRDTLRLDSLRRDGARNGAVVLASLRGGRGVLRFLPGLRLLAPLMLIVVLSQGRSGCDRDDGQARDPMTKGHR
jgi:hypothetical protein